MKTFIHNTIKYEDFKSVNRDGKRIYLTPEGEFPSITTILSKKKQKSIMEWRNRVGHDVAQAITTQASRRGTGVHKLVEDYINNKPNFLQGVIPANIELFRNLQTEIDHSLNYVRGIEVPLWSKLLGVAGRCDCIAEWDGTLSIVDWKTSNKEKKIEWVEDYFIQGTAYAIMFQERTGIKVPQVVIAITREDSNEPQIFKVRPIDYVDILKKTIDNFYCI